MSSKTEAVLTIELNVECPHCEHYFDLFDFNYGRLNDDGYLMKNVFPSSGLWSDTHDRFEEDVECPDCSKEIEIKGIAW